MAKSTNTKHTTSWIKTLTNWFMTVITIIAVTTTNTAHATECPRRCVSCENGRANCNGRSLTVPPKGYPEDTRIIDLQNNHIRIIGSRTFFPRQTAEILKLADNKIPALRNEAFLSFPRLMTLDLTGNRISRIFVRAFAGLSNLQGLSLRRNRIRRIAGIFRGTRNLQQLDLSNNRIGGIQANDLAPLTRMRYLDLRDNLISRIHSRAFDSLTNLRYLFLNNNPIGSAALNLELGPTALQLLDMSNCQLTTVPSSLPSTVSEIRMGNNAIMQINHTDFENTTELRMLTLNNNELHFLAEGALWHLTKLKEIWLRGNSLVYVPRDIPPNVVRIYMDSNRIQEIEAGLFTPDSQLESFSAENNNLRRINPDTFTGMNNLKRISVQRNALQTLEPRTFADLENLEHLIMSNNPLGRIEADAFINLPNLTSLQMSYQTPDVTELNGNFLMEMPQLKNLHIMASPGMAQALVDMIENDNDEESTPMSLVTMVDLSYNNLQWISPKLATKFPNVRSMYLDGNPFQCTERLLWLQEWMASSDITFHQYEQITCDTPLSLRGRQLRSLTAQELRDGAATGGGERSQNLQSRQRSKRRHDTSGYGDVQENKDDSLLQKATRNTEMTKREPLTPLALRAQREQRRKKVVRSRSRSRSKGRKNRKGKGRRRRRNRKGRKNKRRGKKRNKSNSRKNKGA